MKPSVVTVSLLVLSLAAAACGSRTGLDTELSPVPGVPAPSDSVAAPVKEPPVLAPTIHEPPLACFEATKNTAGKLVIGDVCELDVDCCIGEHCMQVPNSQSPNLGRCMPTCTKDSECASGCCAFAGTLGHVCAPLPAGEKCPGTST